MPRRSATLIHDDGVDLAREDRAVLSREAGEPDDGAAGLPWLVPWLLAITGIVITLALMR